MMERLMDDLRHFDRTGSSFTMAVGSMVRVWATAISTNANNGRKILWRFPKEFDPSFDRSSWPVRVIIVWKYQSETGQPVTEEHQRMNFLEDALEPLLAQGQFAILGLVSTGENLREWTFYAKTEDGFEARFDCAIAGAADFPIEIHTARDPTWEMYEEFRAGLIEDVT
jgi:Family of unknown function (DUF695)